MAGAVSSGVGESKGWSAEFFSSMTNSNARWEEGGDIASTSVPLAFSCIDTGRSKAVLLRVLGHAAWTGVPVTCVGSASGTHLQLRQLLA